jgi:hypothetical protein
VQNFSQGVRAQFNLTTGTLINQNGTTSTFITPYGNGWYRIGFTYTQSSTVSAYWNTLVISTDDNSGNAPIAWTGNGTDSIAVYGHTIEAGAYATSYIPTTTAAVTRLVDNFTRNNLFTNNIVTASGGTWFVDLASNLSYTRDQLQGLFLGDNSSIGSGNQFHIRNTGSSSPLQIVKYVAGTPTLFQPTTTSNVKIAIKWNGATADIFINGAKVVTGTVFAVTQLQFLICNGGGTPFFINQSSLFPVPMTDAQCIQMTT